MKITCRTAVSAVALLLALAGCQSENPAPTAESHEPEVPSPYGTDAQETRTHEEALEAEKPNDDPDDER